MNSNVSKNLGIIY